MEILLENVIISWPSLGRPVDCIMADKDTSKKIEDAVNKLIDENLGGKAPKSCFLKSTKDKLDADTGMQLPLYDQGEFWMTAKSPENEPPVLMSPQAKKDYPAQNFKGGNICNVLLEIYTTKRRTVSATLTGVQWVAEGTPFNTKKAPSLGMFKAVAPTQADPSAFKI